MQHIIVKNTERFEAIREKRNQAFSDILRTDTVQTLGGVDGVKKAFSTLKDWANKNDDVTKARSTKMLRQTAADLDRLATEKEGDAEKSMDFYGAVVAQSMSLPTLAMLGRSCGLSEKRNLVSKGGGTEATGLVSGAVGAILQFNTGTAETIDTGWMDLYTIEDMEGISSGKIINLANHIRAQRLEEGQEIKAKKPVSSKNMEDTEYMRYGIAVAFLKMDAILSEYLNTIGGINGLFRAFRTEMARTKTVVAYREITKRPTAKYTFQSTELENPPLGSTSSYKDFMAYRADRFIRNLQEAYRTFIKQAMEDGEVLNSPLPTVHCVYNPYAQGAEVIDAVMNRLNSQDQQYVMSLPIVFHPSIEAPACGAWVAKEVNSEVVYDENGFEVKAEADTEQSFGFMLVLPQGSNIHGVNMALYNATADYLPTETDTYFSFERWTMHASRSRRFWVRHSVPVWESTTQPIAD